VNPAQHFGALRSSAPFFSLRLHSETRELLAVRQDTLEPPRLYLTNGAMLSAVTEGGCGYCATSDLSREGLQQALDRATHWAEATRNASVHAFGPEQMPAPQGEYASPASAKTLDRKDLIALLGAECRAAKLDARIVERYAGLEIVDEERLYLTNTGGRLAQRFRFTLPRARIAASDGADTQVRSLEHAQQGGFEQIERSGFVGSGSRLAEEALQLLAAPNCPSGKMDLLLMPDQMMLQVHESIGHPLELDRILGDERNYAGTSFVTADMFGSYRYGSPLLNVTYDPSRPEEVASFAYDDDGTRAEKVWLIRDGILVAPLGGALSQLRAAQLRAAQLPVLSGTANSRASGWNRPPIDRMANLNIEPGASTLDQMIASIEHGVLMRTNLSWSIDDSRNKFQFGCEWGERIENGRRAGVVRHPNYRGVSATFWRSLRAVGDASTYEVHGTLYCGKGEPNQMVACGHAAPACVFADVDVFGGEA
jgi:predicted Zn-dependent protease